MAPQDTDLVLSAVRLGWYLAEVRGRNRPAGPRPSESKLPSREGHELPLRFERSQREARIEAQSAVEALATKLELNKDPDNANTDVTRVDDLAKQLNDLRKANMVTDAAGKWDQLADLLFKLDAFTQDALAARSDTQACGYQLGRGLSEAYWALDTEPPDQSPEVPPSSGWAFLLGNARCEELSRLAGRLTEYFARYTSAAVAGSLAAWFEVATDISWRRVADAHSSLYRQHRRWYELIVLLQDPSTLIKPYAVIFNLRAIWHAVRAFWLQLIVGAGSLIAIAYFIGYLSSSNQSTFAKGVLGVLSAVGISVTAITGWLKNTAQAISTRIKQDVYTDLVAIQVSIIPGRPRSYVGRQQQAIRTRRAITRRRITIPTPPPA